MQRHGSHKKMEGCPLHGIFHYEEGKKISIYLKQEKVFLEQKHEIIIGRRTRKIEEKKCKSITKKTHHHENRTNHHVRCNCNCNFYYTHTHTHPVEEG